MAELLIKNANLILLNEIAEHCDVYCKNGKILNVNHAKNKSYETIENVVDASGKYLSPGFIDVHIHGLHEYAIEGSPDDLSSICKLLPRYGVTGFLPTLTLTSLPKGRDADYLASLAKVKSEGAQILGFHLEGPFIALTGAGLPEALSGVDTERAKALIEAAKPFRVIFSISPDLDGIQELLPVVTQNNTPAFITHTRANVKQTQAAIALGAKHATHFYDVFHLHLRI